MSEHLRRPIPKFNAELANQFGIVPGADDRPREFVHTSIESIPNPPGVEAVGTARPTQSGLNLEETIIDICKDEFGELATRLARFNVNLDPSSQQHLVDTTLALLSGVIAGGSATSGRR